MLFRIAVITQPLPDASAPRVSVIVPAFNAEHTIGRALASVAAQTWRDFEVIVVDDGSTDATGDVLDAWRGRLVHLRQPNGGPGRARNAGIARSRGELIAFLDADDHWLPDKLARQVEYFDAFPEAGLVHTAVVLGPPGFVPPARSSPNVAHRPPRDLFCEIFETEVEVRTLTVMVRRAALDAVGWFDERREVHVEDWDLWLRVAARYPVGFIPLPLAVHHEGGFMSEGLDETFRGQMLVLDRAMRVYRTRCAMSGRDPGRVRRPLHRVAWELGYARLARNETAPARRAFSLALRHRPEDLRTRVYHLGAHLPAGLVAALRAFKRRRAPVRAAAPVAPPATDIRRTVGRRSDLVHDTVYRRSRRRAAERLHGLDEALDGMRGLRKRILFEAASPLSFVIFKPLYLRLCADPRLEFWFTSTSGSWPADAIFRSVGISERVVPASRASWMKLDACINTDFYEMTWLHRCPVRLHLFHGVAGKYGIDSPRHVAPDIATFNALLFPNRDRLDRYLQAGLIDEQAALLVGFPKIDCLVDGSLDRARIMESLALRSDRPTVLYAPTWSPDSSLHMMGEAVVLALLDAGFNVLVKLHDRSYDLTRRASGGIDWLARFSTYRNRDDVRVITDPDASRYLMAADAVVTDHSSIGFEFALLDRPIVVIDAPALLKRARVSPEKVALLRSAAEVIGDPDDLIRAIDSQLADPRRRRAERRRVADAAFYRPGTATDRAVGVVYDAVGLEPLHAPARAAVAAPGPVVESVAERKVS